MNGAELFGTENIAKISWNDRESPRHNTTLSSKSAMPKAVVNLKTKIPASIATSTIRDQGVSQWRPIKSDNVAPREPAETVK